MSDPALRRVVRRETHSPRTMAMFVAVVVFCAALVLLGVEIVLSLASQSALIVSPRIAADALVDLVRRPAAPVLAISVALVILGVVFVWMAVAPGRLAKRVLRSENSAIVVDNEVIAAALAQHLTEETGMARGRVVVGVGHRQIDVTVRPELGIPLDEAEVRRSAEAAVERFGLEGATRTRVKIERPRSEEEGDA